MRTVKFIKGIFSLCLVSLNGYAQDSIPGSYPSGLKINYVRTWVATAPQDNVDTMMAASVSKVKQTTVYVDGLGRPIQTVYKQGSPAHGGDISTPTYYDQFGRESLKFLPFTSKYVTDGSFKMDPFTNAVGYYAIYDSFPYSKTVFEQSPLDKPDITYPQGSSWEGAGRGVKIQTFSSKATDSVRRWTISSGQPTTSSIYGNNQLTKTITTDENGKQSVEFKDATGKVLLKKVQLDDSPSGAHVGWICTYYIYNDLDELCFVIQPRAVELLLSSSWSLSSTILNELCFIYTYDERHRMITKKVPGAGEVRMVYDARDRLVMAQDSVNRALGKWLVTQYDKLDRPLRTYLWNDTNSRASHQSSASTSIAYPTLSGTYELLTETFFDGYSWTSGTGLSSSFISTYASNTSYFYSASNSTWPYPQSITPDYRVIGLQTGTKTKILGSSSTYLYSSTFYDENGRVIQNQRINPSGEKDTMTMQYSYDGKPLRSLLCHKKGGSGSQNHLVLTKLEYENGGRLIRIDKKLDNGPITAVSLVEYDALGLVIQKKLGLKPDSYGQISDPGNAADSLRYSYNIRNWLTGVNKEFLSDSINAHWFGFELAYDKSNSVVSNTSYSNLQYNGNISGTVWKTGGSQEKRKYDFKYDNVNRLIKADFTQKFETTWSKSDPATDIFTIDFSLDTLRYDVNGNILFMKQHGLQINASPVIDKMTYTYMESGSSNKLKAVTEDTAIGTTNNMLGDFTDLYTGTTDYAYDGNGNLLSDKNKRIDSIYYNYLNLPIRIRVSDSSAALKGIIEYTYDAAGNKISKKTTEGSLVTNTSYLGDFVYKNDTLQFTSHDEGRIRYAKKYYLSGDSSYEYFYDYFLKDHLGNVRVVLTEQRDTTRYMATFETASRDKEKALFVNIDETAYPISSVTDYPSDPTTNPNDYTSRLDGYTKKLGAAITLKVMSGDTVDLGVKVWYPPVTGGAGFGISQNLFTILLSSLSNQAAGLSNGKATSSQLNSYSGPIYPGLQNFLSTHTDSSNPTTRPFAYMNWVLLDEQFRYVPSGSGFIRVPSQDADIQTMANNGIAISKSGYLFVYLSNETNSKVYFDNLSILHYSGPLLEETNYYPFGLTMDGICSKAAGRMENKLKFNDGTELNSDFDINFYETTFRSLDPQIGRFWQIDPLSTFIFNKSPYCFASNNPISVNDPLGLQDSSHKETSTIEKPKTLLEVVVTTKARPSFDASDVVRTILALSSPTEAIQPENAKSVMKMYSTLIDRTSDAMPNPPVLGGPPWMHKQWRINLATDFIRSSIESILMFLPGVDAIFLEEEAILLLTEQGVISRETATKLLEERAVAEASNALKPLGLGSTGRTAAKNLTEQLAMQEAMSNPRAGKVIMEGLHDVRWSGWSKMQYTRTNFDGSKTVIHYVGKFEDGVLKFVDDFKFIK